MDVFTETIKKLKDGGFTGLFHAGDCACEVADLAPCGELEKDGEYINGCSPGYKHDDPEGDGFYVVNNCKDDPDAEEWDEIRLLYK